MKKRIYWVDFARFIAIVLVTGFHVWRIIGTPEHYYLGFDLWGIFKNGYIGCDLFFLLSGFLCSIKWESIKREKKLLSFYKDKIIRIIPAYYVGIIIWWLLVNKGICVKPYEVKDIIMHILFIHTFREDTFFSTSGVYWYLGVQMHFYLLFPALIFILNKINRWLVLLLSFIPVIVLSYYGNNGSIVIYWNAIIFMPTFIVGVMMYKGDFDCLVKKITFPIFSLLYIGIVCVPQIDKMFFLADRIIAGISLGIVLYELASMLEISPIYIKEFVGVIAKTSYSIYLYNYIFGTYEIILKGKIGFIIYVFMTLGFGVIMYYLVENTINYFIDYLKQKTRNFKGKIKEL